MIQRVGTVAPRVYSYIRFSTPEQKMGDSERRQIGGAKAWVERNGYTLDDTPLMDEGRSGYHGAHRKHGALSKFLANVEAGLVPHGSILLVENIDRLSREGAASTLREIIFKLWDRGIVLQTLSPEETYPPNCDSHPKFLALLLYMQRARDESEQKSLRIRASRDRARERAREEGRTLTRQLPWWLRATVDGERVPIEEAAATIRNIFKWKAQGLGVRTIAARLNTSAAWSPPPREKAKRVAGLPGNGWRPSYLRKILANRAVIGEYQPHLCHGGRGGKRAAIGDPIAGFFPSIVDKDLFHTVQQLLAANRGKGGRTGKATNVLRHLAVCAYCGGPMAYIDKGKKSRPALVCDNGNRRVKCKRHRIRFDECVDVLLDNCPRLRPEQVLPNPKEDASRCQAIEQRLKGAAGELAEIESQIENLIEQIGRTNALDIRDRYEARVAQLSVSREELLKRQSNDQREMQTLSRRRDSFKEWKRGLADLKAALATDAEPEIRIRLNAHLRSFIEKIEVFAVGFQERFNFDGKTQDVEDFAETFEALLETYAPQFARQRDHREFAEYVVARRMSEHGRFLRIHFTTGMRADVVPAGSLASGMELTKDKERGWRFTSPDLERLWRNWLTS